MEQGSEIHLELTRPDDWKPFVKLTNEMVISPNGLLLNPILEYRVSNLDPRGIYKVAITMLRCSDKEFWQREGKWFSRAVFDMPEIKEIIHSDGWQTGAFWMRNGIIDFAALRLSNYQYVTTENCIFIQPRQIYNPEIRIYQQIAGPSPCELLVSRYSSELTVFFAVTKFKNEELKKLKRDSFNNMSREDKNNRRKKARKESANPKNCPMPIPTHDVILNATEGQNYPGVNQAEHFQEPIHFPHGNPVENLQAAPNQMLDENALIPIHDVMLNATEGQNYVGMNQAEHFQEPIHFPHGNPSANLPAAPNQILDENALGSEEFQDFFGPGYLGVVQEQEPSNGNHNFHVGMGEEEYPTEYNQRFSFSEMPPQEDDSFQFYLD